MLLLLLSISSSAKAAVIALTLTCARRAVSGEMDDLSVPSRRRMACDMSHIFCATVPLWEEITKSYKNSLSVRTWKGNNAAAAAGFEHGTDGT